MRVRIGDFWYDSKKQPLCVELDQDEQEQISRLINTQNKLKFFSKPDRMTDDYHSGWINKIKD